MENRQVAQKLIEDGAFIIPLFPNSKKNGDTDILDRIYHATDVGENYNVGINLGLSGYTTIDLDSKDGIYFGNKYLPQDTTKHIRVYPDGREEVVHYLFKSNGVVNENNPLGNDAKENVELLVKGNLVAYGTTIHKQTNEPMKRLIDSKHAIKPFNDSIFNAYKKVCFASAIVPHLKSANTGALALDSCLWRYCKDWTDEEREDFLFDIFSYVLPNDRDSTRAKMRRIIKSNNNDSTNNAGYVFLANYIGVEKSKVREWCGWIGTVHEEKAKKTYRDFTNGVDMKALRTKDIPPLKFAIDQILPEGLVLFCGRAKSMKSWTMLLICYLVQNGMDALGRETTQGDCLYLGLEDSERRLKDREKKLGIDTLTPPYVDVDAPYLKMGLEDSLQKWIEAVNNPRLIVIDTLARVKQAMGKRSGTAYDHDNETLRDIQKLAVKNGVTIVLVSHLNKAPQDYAFDKITGSTGLQGMCDAMWLCERGEHGAPSTLIGRGRDIHDFEYSLTWNEETWRYDYLGNLAEVTLNDNRKEIINAMKQITADGLDKIRPRDVIKHCGYAVNSKEASNISRTMQRMKNNFELIAGFTYGTYRLPVEDVNSLNEAENIKGYKDSFRTTEKKKYSCL